MAATTTGLGSGPFTDMISSIDRRCEFVENQAGANVRVNNFLTPTTLDNKSSILNAPCGYSNGVYASLRPVQTFGSELITNGDFATDSNWTKGTGWSIANGKASRTAQSGSTACDQSISLIAGKKYKIVYTLTMSAGSFNVRFSGTTNVNGLSRTTSGTYIDYLVAATGNNTFRLVGADGSFVGGVDNVSVKEATDADFDFTRGSAATRVTKDGLVKNVQILSNDLVQNGDFKQIGSELIPDGNFTNQAAVDYWNIADTGGVERATKSLENGFMRLTYDIANGSALVRSGIVTSGKSYKVTFRAKGTANSNFNSIGDNVNIPSNPQYVVSNPTLTNNWQDYEFYVPVSSTTFRLYLTSAQVGDTLDITNISVKEVGQNWTLEGGWSVEDGLLVNNGTGVNLSATQSGFFTVGNKYRVSLNVKSITQGSLEIYLGFPQSDIKTINSSGSYTYDIVASGNTTFYIKPLSNFIGSIDNVSVIEITDDTNLPRIDYTDGTGSLLLEPQSTNLIINSENIGTGVSVHSLNIDNSETTSPEGLVNAAMITTTATTQPRMEQFVNYNRTYAVSCFIKKNIGDYFGFGYYEALVGNSFVRFNISSGLDGDISYEGTMISNGKIESFNDNWYRISAKITTGPSGTKSGAKFIAMKSDSLSNSNIGNKYYIYGLQLEESNFATSYIPTSGSTVTRNADVCNNAGSSDLINSTEGVLYFEGSDFDTSYNSGICISDLTYDNRVLFYFDSSGNVRAYVFANGAQLVYTTTGLDYTINHKYAIAWKNNDMRFFVDGVMLYSQATGNAPTGMNNLSFTSATASSDKFRGNAKCLSVFKEALTDEELAKITSVTQQEAFYEMRDKMLQINADYYEFGDYTTRLKKLF